MSAPRLRVLVVDDSYSARRLAVMHVSGNDVQVFEASSVEQALSVLSREQVDVVLTDMMMADASGLELARKIRENDSIRNIGIVMLTGTEAIDLAPLREQGVLDAFLRKPPEPKSLVKAVEEAASRSKQGRSSRFSSRRRLRVALAAATRVTGQLLSSAFSRDSRFDLIGVTRNDYDTARLLEREEADVLVLPMSMMAGGTASFVRQVQSRAPTRVVLVAAVDDRTEIRCAFDAVAAGALDVVPAPVVSVYDLGSVDVILKRLLKLAMVPKPSVIDEQVAELGSITDKNCIVGVVGGIGAVHSAWVLLRGLSRAKSRMRVILSQDVTSSMLPGFADWLEARSGFPCGALSGTEALQPGRLLAVSSESRVVVTEEDHLTITESSGGSGDILSSLERARGPLVAVVLSGTPASVTATISRMKSETVRVVVQEPATCIVPDGPSALVKKGLADAVVQPAGLGKAVLSCLNAM